MYHYFIENQKDIPKFITKTRLFKYTKNFTTKKKKWKFSDKNSDI